MEYASGENLYGRVDNIRGVGYLATVFKHFNFIPLSPIQTYLVLHRPGIGGFLKARTEWTGLTIPAMMGRSILAAWLRTAAFFYVIWRFLVLMYEHSNADPPSNGRLALAVVIFVLAWCTRYIPASFGRAVQLLKLADAPDEVARQVEQAYGRPIRDTWPGRQTPGPSPRAPIGGDPPEEDRIDLDAATGAQAVAAVAAQPTKSRAYEQSEDDEELVSRPSLVMQALRATSRPSVSTPRELLVLGLVGIAVGMAIAVAGGLLARMLVMTTGIGAKIFGLPAIYGLVVAGIGFYRALFGLWPGLARDSACARLARIGLSVVAFSLVGAVLIVGLLALNDR